MRTSSLFYFPKFKAFLQAYVFGRLAQGYRCMSACRSRGREFDPSLVLYFHGVDDEIFSMAILLPSAESLRKGCCQLQPKICA